MSRFWLLALLAHCLVGLYVVVRVLWRRREPTAMVAWIFAILTLPGLGILLYWLVASDRLRRKVSRRRRRVAHLLAQYRRWSELERHRAGREAEDPLPEDFTGIEQLGSRLVGMPATGGNQVAILEEANATYAALEDAIRAAQHHIHLEYYIWQPDDTGRNFRSLIVEAARRGVQCRLLLDAVGCWRLDREFLHPLVEAGVGVAFFMPLWPSPLRKRWSLHLRNHRKIAVFDGQTAFIGSQNIGDEYRGRLQRLSPWYDTHMRVVGPAAFCIQQTFAEDWYFATRQQLDVKTYFTVPERPGQSFVQILPTGPDQRLSTLAHILFAAVALARSSIRIATPYFVPDPATRMALTYACCRGVQVRLVLPTRSDSNLSLWAARSFYQELSDAGVEIHEYDGGVLHSKLVTIDDRWCMLGSANMDARSFRLNFEVTALIYDQHVAAGLARSIDAFCADARRITLREIWQRGSLRRIGEGAARLFAPLL